jgi:Putative metallopeptidase domain
MRFSKIIGDASSLEAQDLIRRTEKTLSSLFAELSLGWDVQMGSFPLGGDPLQMQLLVPLPHHCDLTAFHFRPLKEAYRKLIPTIKANKELTEDQKQTLKDFLDFQHKHPRLLTTAATDGLRFYWEPEFLLAKSHFGQRLLLAHESNHATLLHPTRKGARIHQLWNIAADYRVNFLIFEDLRIRGFKYPSSIFNQHLGQFITLEEYAAFLRDPYHPPPRLEQFGRMASFRRSLQPGYELIDEDMLNEELPQLYYADPHLPLTLRQPEAIYDYLLKQVPRCECCGKLGIYKKPKDFIRLEKEQRKSRG